MSADPDGAAARGAGAARPAAIGQRRLGRATATPSRPASLTRYSARSARPRTRAVGLARARHRDADRDRDAELRLGDGRAQPRPGLERLVRRRATASSAANSSPPMRYSVSPRRSAPVSAAAIGAQHVVAVLVAVGVVEALEAVEVDEHDRGLRAAVRPRERLVEGRVVAEAR